MKLPRSVRRRSLVACTAASTILSACVTDSPSLHACREFGRSQNQGNLRVLTSGVPGITIDSARWFTQSSTIDFGVETRVIFAGVLHSTTDVPLDSMVLVYFGNGSGPPMLMGHADGMPIWTADSLPRDLDTSPQRIAAGGTRRVENSLSAFTDMATNTDWVKDCPASVQAVWLHDAIRLSGLDDEARRHAEATAAAGKDSAGPVRVLVDTIVPLRKDLTDDLWAAAVLVNDSDQPAKHVTIGFLGERRRLARSGFTEPEPDVERVDLGTLDPHERRTVLGPQKVFLYRYMGAAVASNGRPLPSTASRYTPQPW